MKIRNLASFLKEGNILSKDKNACRDHYLQITVSSMIELCDHINKLQTKVDSMTLQIEAKGKEETYCA